jgi:hypothetical protein
MSDLKDRLISEISKIQPSQVIAYARETIRRRPSEPEAMQRLISSLEGKRDFNEAFPDFGLLIDLLVLLLQSKTQNKQKSSSLVYGIITSIEWQRHQDYENYALKIGLSLNFQRFEEICLFFFIIMPAIIRAFVEEDVDKELKYHESILTRMGIPILK